MSFAFSAMLMLLGSSSVVLAFVLQPSHEKAAVSSMSRNRCQFESVDIKKHLLRELNLQTEPRLPAGGLDALRERWQRNFGALSDRTTDISVATTRRGDRRNLECCAMTSEIFMKDLGWDDWVVYPPSLTFVQCALCNYETNTVQCPSSHARIQDDSSQVPCCLPHSKEMVPVVYVDETGTVVLSSVYLTRSCSCEAANIQQPGTE
ncbi:growth/differentiation factor 6-like [Cynoglossus semilaevis]|uniref:Growth/differentiation factor 6-like n=1 Tax=Cynoglossus semilaevis TaxID=244447 RepID=A0A3P8UDN9_CYNSE|nr:growth/differentiation factor 6-like [Cynoglossus semilaevis]